MFIGGKGGKHKKNPLVKLQSEPKSAAVHKTNLLHSQRDVEEFKGEKHPKYVIEEPEYNKGGKKPKLTKGKSESAKGKNEPKKEKGISLIKDKDFKTIKMPEFQDFRTEENKHRPAVVPREEHKKKKKGKKAPINVGSTRPF